MELYNGYDGRNNYAFLNFAYLLRFTFTNSVIRDNVCTCERFFLFSHWIRVIFSIFLWWFSWANWHIFEVV